MIFETGFATIAVALSDEISIGFGDVEVVSGACTMQITLERSLRRMTGMKYKDPRRSRRSANHDGMPLRKAYRWDDCSDLPAP